MNLKHHISDIEYYIKKGRIKIIPLRKNSKIPADNGYFDKKYSFNELESYDGNFGVVVGANHNNCSLAIIDIDGYTLSSSEDTTKIAEVKQVTKDFIFECLKDMPDAMHVRTQSGGYHIYLWNKTVSDKIHETSNNLCFPADFEIPELVGKSLAHSIEIFTKEGRKENNSLIIDIMNNAHPIGKYEWTFTYSGDDIYESSKETSVTNILITPTKITANAISKLFVDDTARISYNLTPDGAVGDIVFTSNDTSVVEVDQNGNIKAIAEGTALITVTFEGSENYTASSTNITITVSKIPTEINITNETVELKALQNISGLATLNPARAGNLTYTSSDENIVRISDDGIIYALIKGTATITVSFTGNNKYKAAENKTIKVTVTLNDARVSVNNGTLNLSNCVQEYHEPL